jgi:hypothetical protein
MKIVINHCFGGFGLSNKAFARYLILTNQKSLKDISEYEIPRNDPALVQVVEEMGARANGRCAELKVVEIPDGVQWTISEYDGNEHIAEVHRTWS